jgi:hydrogenase 3 maturation protease
MEMMKILPDTWKVSLHRLLSQLNDKGNRSARIAIVGVGNPFRSDDAVGIRIVHALSGQEWAAATDQVLILDAGHAPENCTGELRRFAPNLVLLIDAAELGGKPGRVEWIPEESIDGMSASTHSLPLSMLARYLTLELGCKVAVLGIQPGSNEVGERISPPVLQIAEEVAREIGESIRICIISACQV